MIWPRRCAASCHVRTQERIPTSSAMRARAATEDLGLRDGLELIPPTCRYMVFMLSAAFLMDRRRPHRWVPSTCWQSAAALSAVGAIPAPPRDDDSLVSLVDGAKPIPSSLGERLTESAQVGNVPRLFARQINCGEYGNGTRVIPHRSFAD
jgi:hypothetical protein